MPESTVDTYVQVNDPTTECVILTHTDGNTFTSRKFKKVNGCQATWAEDMGVTDHTVSYAVSSNNVVTLHAQGVTDKKLFVTLYGVR